MERWRTREIDRDFLILDFILLMTVVLAGVGVTNTLMIQVLARSREFSVLKTLGVDRRQLVGIVLLEGLIQSAVSRPSVAPS